MSETVTTAKAEAERLRRELEEAQERWQRAERELYRAQEAERERRKDPALDLGISSDYAVLTVGRRRFYYGYEVQTPDGEWCFQVTGGGADVVIPKARLQAAAGLDERAAPERFLLVGLGMFIRAGGDW
jgi:hypothetical protein